MLARVWVGGGEGVGKERGDGGKSCGGKLVVGSVDARGGAGGEVEARWEEGGGNDEDDWW